MKIIQNFPMVLLLLAQAAYAQPPVHTDWPVYGGDKASRKYSPLKNINRENVRNLKSAWTYHSGTPGLALPPMSQLQINPLVIQGVLYGLGPQAQIFAIKADSGKPLWTTTPLGTSEEVMFSQKRGLVHWQEGEETRLFTGIGHQLIAINPRSGKLINGFGHNGSVDLREHLGHPIENLMVAGSTPGIIYKDVLIMGTRVGEHEGAAPGHVRAYDVRTGKMRWIFHTIPQPGEAGHETWPQDAWKTAGGANAWAGMSLDEERGLVFLPLGSPSGDFIGINRPGANLYSNSLIVLNAVDGSLRWHYQIVHHDLWDRDLNSPPTLVSVEREQRFVKMVKHQPFTPLGFEETIVFPGYDGGSSWGSAAYDPASRTIFVNAMNYPSVSRIIAQEFDDDPVGKGELIYQQACAFCHLAIRQGIQHFSPSLIDIGERFSKKELREIIAQGRGRMMGVPMPDEAMNSMLEYLIIADQEITTKENGSAGHVTLLTVVW